MREKWILRSLIAYTSMMLALIIWRLQLQQADMAVGYVQSYPVIIHSVSPAPPYCVLRNSSNLYERLLELTGENFSTTDHNLQFRKVDTGELSIHFHAEVNWESMTRITVDMGLIKSLLWSNSKVTLTARITSASLEPLSDWSPEFILANDVTACGIAQPAPTPIPLPVRGVAGDLWADVIIGKPDFSPVTSRIIPLF
jgi:hypothetical protein